MKQLILLYWGCVLLMYLSQIYYPVEAQLVSHRKRSFIRDSADLFEVIIMIWMICFMFLRTSYNDTGNYIFEWRHKAPPLHEFLESGELLKLGSNPLFKLYTSALHAITDNFHFFFFFPAVCSSVSVIKLIKRYSASPTFSLLIFYSIGTFIMYLAAMKQCFAIAILFIALPYAINRKYVKFYLLVFFAMMFHTHAFIFLAVPFLFSKPWGKFTWLCLLAVIVAILAYDPIFHAVMDFALSLGVNVADFELFDGHSINPIRVIVFGIPAVLSFFFRNRLFSDSNRVENMFVNMSILSVFILSIGLRQGANLFARMAAYYEIAISFSVPWIIKKLFTKQSAQMVTAMATVLYFGYFLYEFGISKSFGDGYASITIWQFIQELVH